MTTKKRSPLSQTAFDVADELLETVDLAIDQHQNLYSLIVDEASKGVIEKVLMTTLGNQSKAARILGINRSTLRSHLQRLGIRSNVYTLTPSSTDPSESKR